MIQVEAADTRKPLSQELAAGFAMFLQDMASEDTPVLDDTEFEWYGDIRVCVDHIRGLDDYFQTGDNAGRM